MAEKIYEDPEFGSVRLRKSARSRRVSLRVSPRTGITLTLPFTVTYREALAFFLAKRDWVREVLARQAALPQAETLSPSEILRLRAEARAVLVPRLMELADRHGFTVNQVRIKNNRSNWGSCSCKGNINLNLRLMLVREELRDYVLLHELCHLRHPDHGPAFHALLESLCPSHRTLERELRRIRLA